MRLDKHYGDIAYRVLYNDGRVVQEATVACLLGHFVVKNMETFTIHFRKGSVVTHIICDGQHICEIVGNLFRC